MNTTASFPPVDDFIARLSQVEWRKLWNNSVLIVATICAVCVALGSYFGGRLRSWYESGGKDDCVLFALKCRTIARVCYHWIADCFIPQVIELYQDAVTVAKVAQGHLR